MAVVKLCISFLVLPDQQESITDVLVGRAAVRIDDWVANLSDLIDKDHDFGFEDFSGVCEVSDITEAVNSHDFLTGNDDVDEFRILDDFGDDFGTGLTETNCKEPSNLDNKVLKCIGLS